MTVLRLDNGWNGDVFDSALSAAGPRSATRNVKPSNDWSPRKKFLCLVFASLASWAIVLAPLYALVQFV